MSRRKRIGLVDSVESALDALPGADALPVPAAPEAREGVQDDVFATAAPAPTTVMETAVAVTEAMAAEAATAVAVPGALLPDTPLPDLAGPAVEKTAPLDAVEATPSLADTAVAPCAPVSTTKPSQAGTAEPSPARIGVFSALGGLTGGSVLPALIGLGVGLLPMVGGLALGTAAGLSLATRAGRKRDDALASAHPGSLRSKA